MDLGKDPEISHGLTKYNFNSSYIGKFRGFLLNKFALKCTEDYYIQKEYAKCLKLANFFYLLKDDIDDDANNGDS